jgi:hypothetical protein
VHVVSRAAYLLHLGWHSAWEREARTVARGLERRHVEAIAPLGLDKSRDKDFSNPPTNLAVRRARAVAVGSTLTWVAGALANGLKPVQRAAAQVFHLVC